LQSAENNKSVCTYKWVCQETCWYKVSGGGRETLQSTDVWGVH